jgi:hypothetical protein
MSEPGDGNGNSNGSERVTLPLEALIDEITITFRRADGTLNVGGRICNLEVALDMCNRAARHFEQQIRLAAVLTAKQQLAEQQRVQDLLAQTRGGRG